MYESDRHNIYDLAMFVKLEGKVLDQALILVQILILVLFPKFLIIPSFLPL